MKRKLNLITRTLIQALGVAFLVFILPGWSSRGPLTAQVDPTETLPTATEAPEPTKAETPATLEPQPTKNTGGIDPATGQWVYVTTENFEGVFPTMGWTVQDLSNDGFERFWDDDNYRFHLGAWAAWPARGGANGTNPTSSNNNYFNNMNTRLIYGPFDLSDATQADTDFYLWRELEDCCDFLAFEISHDGLTFQELRRWTTTSTAWEFKDIYYDSYVGDSSVFIAWRFYSNSSITFDGPWLDDVHVWKFLPNPPTATPTRTVTRTPTRTLTPTCTRTPTRTPTTGPMIPRAYLPSVANRYPPIKVKSGVHLGNRGSDWNTPTDFLARLRGTTQGDWPRVVVVLSSQLYTITRSTTSPCNITGAEVRDTYLYNYLTDAIKKGMIVIIRIYPSPGNFTDWANPGQNHTLLTGTMPAGGNYCNGNSSNYRAINDITEEMNAIYQRNTNSTNNWPAFQFFFEPANEPNKEFYADKGNVSPNIDNQAAWQAMDAYFSALYDNAKSLNSNLQVLTPAMAQGTNAEKWSFGSCDLTALIVNDVPTASAGYDWMQQLYTTKNDGYSWHNYWRQAKEFWQSDFCQGQNPPMPTSDHIFQYFPQWLQDAISTSSKPAFITEADLLSPCPEPLHNVVNKEGSVYSVATQNSLLDFIAQEDGADYVAVWLLTNGYQDPPLPNSGINIQTCDTADPQYGNYEQAWHEAYRDLPYQGSYERDWFRLWWLSLER